MALACFVTSIYAKGIFNNYSMSPRWIRGGTNSQRGAKRRVGYNHSYPTRANGIIVLLNSSLVKINWTFHFDVNDVIV